MYIHHIFGAERLEMGLFSLQRSSTKELAINISVSCRRPETVAFSSATPWFNMYAHSLHGLRVQLMSWRRATLISIAQKEKRTDACKVPCTYWESLMSDHVPTSSVSQICSLFQASPMSWVVWWIEKRAVDTLSVGCCQIEKKNKLPSISLLVISWRFGTWMLFLVVMGWLYFWIE